ncbi:MAG: helix-turn-helix domain-containing protein [Thermoanaerobaculales bacterium]|nr:helix-turn-helix domain-containing protein [Thermoanaerobaculales bacterium]
MDEERYSIGEIAERGGVTRRTVRYYVQRGLIPEPLGRGRGEHYASEHLAAVLRVKALQEEGATLEEIRRRLAGEPPAAEPAARPAAEAAGRRPRREIGPGQIWVRQAVLPGVELHVLGAGRALTELQLAALASFINGLEGEGGTNGS